MNQILVTEKLYITPELRKKKKMYKFDFFISVFLVCVLFSYYIYAEYDKTKNEAISKEILQSLTFEDQMIDDTTIKMEENAAIVVILNAENEGEGEVTVSNNEGNNNNENPDDSQNGNNNNGRQNVKIGYTETGKPYYVIGRVYIPSIEVDYPIFETDLENIDEVLKISPTKFWGCEPNEVGNFCLVGHNYRNTRFFSKVLNMNTGDTIEITDYKNRTLVYEVYDKYEVDPEDRYCTSQKTNGRKEVTLITCTNDSQRRVIVKAKEII